MSPVLIIGLLALYVVGVVLFFIYASMFNKGWNNTYAVPQSLGFAAQWPWTLIKLAIKGLRR